MRYVTYRMSSLVLLFYLPGYETFRREEMPPERIRVRFILWNIFIEIRKLWNMREWLILLKINRLITTQVNMTRSTSGFLIKRYNFSAL